MKNSSRVVLNTGFLYARKIITIIISLYSTRLILDALGVVDYGIFSLIAGVIGMLAFLKGSMAVSTQRYMSFYLGSEKDDQQKTVFQTSIQLHLIIGVLLVIAMEIAGLFLFDGFLNIPEERIGTAKLVYHFMVVSTFFTINAVPYDAAINAHEDLFFEAFTGVMESVIKLGIAIWITFYEADRLVLFGLLIAVLTIFIRIIKGIYCHVKYEECRNVTNFNVNSDLFKEMYSFAGWNMFGALAGIGRSQGIAVILNLFFGAAINAAYGIANQVSGQIQSFSTLMLKAVNPQIMKSEGGKDRKRMLRLSMISSKFSFYLMAVISIPILFEMKGLLDLWLNEVPDYTAVFCQLVIISVLISQLTIGLQSGLQATGKIKIYQTVIGLLLLANLPISYLLLKMEFPPYIVLVSFIVLECLGGVGRVYLTKKIADLDVKVFLNRVITKNIIPISVTFTATYLFVSNLNFDFRFLLTGIVSSLIFLPSVYFYGLMSDERVVVDHMIKKVWYIYDR